MWSLGHKQTPNDRNTRFSDTELIKNQRLKIIETVKMDSSHKGRNFSIKEQLSFMGTKTKRKLTATEWVTRQGLGNY